MPEVIPMSTAELRSLTPQQRLQKSIEGESDLIEHHLRRAQEAKQRRRDYEAELRKLGGESDGQTRHSREEET